MILTSLLSIYSGEVVYNFVAFWNRLGSLKMPVFSPRNSDVIGLGYPLDIRVCSCLLGNSNMQPGLRTSEPMEVKFARPVISFVVFCSQFSQGDTDRTSLHVV